MGRYGVTTNSNISMNAVNTSTSMGTAMSNYRGRAGIQSTGEVKFSDLRGVYTTTGTTSGYYTLNGTNYTDYIVYGMGLEAHGLGSVTLGWHGYAAPGNWWSQSPWIGGYEYIPNLYKGGYSWGMRLVVDSYIPNDWTIGMAALMNGNYSMTMGSVERGEEQAMAFGMQMYQSVNSSYSSYYPDRYMVISFNMIVAQKFVGYAYDTDPGATVYGRFCTPFFSDTRVKMTGMGVTTGGVVYFAIFDTSPFQTGAALSSTWSINMYDYSSLNNYHKNNQINFGLAYPFIDYNHSNAVAANGAANSYYCLGVADVGFRNAKNGFATRKYAVQTPVAQGGPMPNTTGDVAPFDK